MARGDVVSAPSNLPAGTVVCCYSLLTVAPHSLASLVRVSSAAADDEDDDDGGGGLAHNHSLLLAHLFFFFFHSRYTCGKICDTTLCLLRYSFEGGLPVWGMNVNFLCLFFCANSNMTKLNSQLTDHFMHAILPHARRQCGHTSKPFLSSKF